MDAVVYVNKPLKKINGTLFYCFEYFAFLKRYIKDLKFIFVYDSTYPFERDTDDATDIEYFKSIFVEKYDFDHAWLNDIVPMKPIPFMQARVKNVIMFDVHSYKLIQDFLGRTEKLLLYSNKPEGQLYLNKRKDRDTFYGWYDEYQFYNIKNRLKLYREIHKKPTQRGDKIFISSANGNNLEIANHLKLDISGLYLKEPNLHFTELFKNIYKIIYWHCGNNDANNRIIVESIIHNIPIDIHINGFENDSVYDRKVLIEQGRVDELFLTEEDVMIQDFIKICQPE